MKLQGRNLTNGTRGDDVRLLHKELALLGFRLIPDSETRPGIFGPHTLVVVRDFQKRVGLPVTGIVDEATARAINEKVGEPPVDGGGTAPGPLRVRGQVTTADGGALGGAVVRAFDRDLRSETLLGRAVTDAEGRYEIRYRQEAFRKPEKGSADIVVKVASAEDRPLASSPLLFNAPDDAVVDVTVPAEVLPPPSLFAAIGRELQPVLEGVAVEQLEEDGERQDLTFLSGETGFGVRELARFGVAHRLAQPSLPAVFWFGLLGGSWFRPAAGLSLAQQAAGALDALPAVDAAAARKTLTRALNLHEIPADDEERLPGWVDAFVAFAAARSVSGQGGPTFVGSALAAAGIREAAKQQRFALIFNRHGAWTADLLAELTADPSFAAAEVADLRTSFELADVARADFSVVRAIRQGFGVNEPHEIRSLARRSEGEWVELISGREGEIDVPLLGEPPAGHEVVSKAELYGIALAKRFHDAFPTAAFAGGLSRALQNGGVRGLRRAEELARVLDQHPDLELRTTNVEDFLRHGLHQDLSELAKDSGFVQALKAVQRMSNLAPTFAATDALLADGIHSAHQLYRLGETAFVRRYGDRPGFTRESASQTWSQAARTHAAVLTVVADLKALEAEGTPVALPQDSAALATFPNWNNLFRTGDLCECEHCRSVLSPAAYFTDLLLFLRDRQAVDGSTVKDVLLARRPDLGYLELDCDNALTPLPYVDVVCEVLEAAIAAGQGDVPLPSLTAIAGDPTTARSDVATAFATHGVQPGGEFTLGRVGASDRWVAHGDDATHLLHKKAPGHYFATILPNTKAGAAELRAYPQYVDEKAYEVLRAARHPLTLPFDLFAEEVRAGFRKSGLQRWDLMRTLRGAGAPNNATDGELAAEFFGISADPAASFDEKRLILDADTSITGQQEIWGETGNPGWLTEVRNVKRFLDKTGLEYGELLALLDLPFLNSAGDIAVHHLDSSCDLEQKAIEVLDATKLDRIHRFLRLWRKLGAWKLWELDLAIRHPRLGAGTLDELFLVNLFYFQQVRARLGSATTVEQALGLFGDLNTETRFIRQHEKREDGFYQQLFLNRRLIRPLDPAFVVAAVAVAGSTVEKVSGHLPVVLSALGIREADLTVLRGLVRSVDVTPYVTDDLILHNLSFLWRHAWLCRRLKLKAEDWKLALKLLPRDLPQFATDADARNFLKDRYHVRAAALTPTEVDERLAEIAHQDLGELACPKSAWELLEEIDQVKASGFTLDELNWVLSADRAAKAATKEADVTRFLTALHEELQSVRAENDPAEAASGEVEGLTTLLTSLLQRLNRSEAEALFFLAVLQGPVVLEAGVTLPPGFAFPVPVTGSPHHAPITYDEPTKTLRFHGLLTADLEATLLDASLLTVAGDPNYQAAIEELARQSRDAAARFAVAEVDVSLAAGVTLPADGAAIPLRYDPQAERLRFLGVMTPAERAALEASGNPAAQLDELFAAPRRAVGFFPSGHAWLTEADLDASQAANDTLAKRLANAAGNALQELRQVGAENAVVQQASARLGLTPDVTRLLLTRYPRLPATLLEHLTTAFAASTATIDYASSKATFDGWYWAERVATVWKRWQLVLADDLEVVLSLTAGAQWIDFLGLPLDAAEDRAFLCPLVRATRLLKLRESLTQDNVTLLEVLEKLNGGGYPAADFAADAALLQPAWRAADVEGLVASLEPAYPGDYLLAETWERLGRAFTFLAGLNAGAATAASLGAAAMGKADAKALKELLRGRFGGETWLVVSGEIQDVLRERKRDALVAYLLTHPPQPPEPEAPTGKWESSNDLYAYYLLDVEMCSCQLTSRLVQGSGSVQLFVQRCFMGLEPDVEVVAGGISGDSAWRWWKWLRKYRVWEANRKVFLWPENWIEPELRRDKSAFFRDLEGQLTQNEVTAENVEDAFLVYLEKLGGVAQLEIAGSYQEDDGDEAILHLFGRTPGAEPHVYYYRRYDYRRWSFWEKVDLNIQGDYLIPAVVNQRLFLFWPVFTEVPDEAGNKSVKTPAASSSAELPETKKRLRLQMAVSEYRQGKWTPKKVSTDAHESPMGYAGEIDKRWYRFWAVDRSTVDGRFGIQFAGSSAPRVQSSAPANSDAGIAGWLYLNLNAAPPGAISGAFELTGCRGVPELTTDSLGTFEPAVLPESAAVGSLTELGKWVELSRRLDGGDDFRLESNGPPGPRGQRRSTPVLEQSPGIFRMTPPWHLSSLDQRSLDGSQILRAVTHEEETLFAGLWLPFFYNDRRRTFMEV